MSELTVCSWQAAFELATTSPALAARPPVVTSPLAADPPAVSISSLLLTRPLAAAVSLTIPPPKLTLSSFHFPKTGQNDFQKNLAKGRPNAWQCGAGGRYLYICEDGLVHWCSQQRGYPGVPLADYTPGDVERESTSDKSCSPLCTVSCVHRVALLDRLRVRPMETIDEMLPKGGDGPISVRLLRWGLVTSRHRRRFRAVAARLLGSRS